MSNILKDQEQTIKLLSSDGRVFPVSLDIARMSSMIRTLLDDLERAGKNRSGDSKIALRKVKGSILEHIVEWCDYHKNDREVEEEEDIRGIPSSRISVWDQDFLDGLGEGALYDLMVAADYLDISGLLTMTCKAVANMIKGKSTEEMRSIFKVRNDFTPSEEEQIRQENEWCEEK